VGWRAAATPWVGLFEERRIFVLVHSYSYWSQVMKRSLLSQMTEDFVGGGPNRRTMLDEAYANVQASQLIYDMRTNAGLTQAQLAKKNGTAASVISRLERADYSGHTLAMLNRIAAAVGRRIRLQAVPKEAA
jgi:ribosome-binding protein aMBF1 (putative translation factor)